MTANIRIVVADDHPVVRVGTITLLQRDPNLQVVGEAGDGAQAVTICRKLLPDLLILEARLPAVEGIMVAQTLKATNRALRILVFSASSAALLVRAALAAGADGYVLKTVPAADLLAAIHRVMRGERVLLGVDSTSSDAHAPLSPREALTLLYLDGGLPTQAIAARLGIGTRTVETYLTRMYNKLGVSTRGKAVALAHQERLLTARESGA